MKILQITSTIDPRAGGVATAFIKLSISQHRAGLNVTAATSYRDTEEITAATGELRSAGVNLELLGPGHGTRCTAPGMRDHLRRLIASADVVHIHALWEEIQHLAAAECRKARIPYLISPHGMLDQWSLSQRSLKKKIYLALRLRGHLTHAAALHVTTPAERDSLAPLNLNVPIIVEPLGLDLAEFETLPPKGFLREKFPQIDARPIILFLSRIHYKKGLDLLLPAFAKSDTNNAVLVLAGPGEDSYLSELRSEIKKLGIEDRVFFTGMLRGPERVSAYVDADLFVLPSHQENFGIVVIEALAAQCPVLISQHVNIHDQITAANLGGSHTLTLESLSAALTNWMHDEPLRQSISAKSRDFVWSTFDWNKIAAHWVDHYRGLK